MLTQPEAVGDGESLEDVQCPLKDDVQNSDSAVQADSQLSLKDDAPQVQQNEEGADNRDDSASPKERSSTAWALLQPNEASRSPQKRRNEDVRKEFTFKEIIKDGSKKTESYCKHCEQRVQTAKKVNITTLTGHLNSACKACPAAVKEVASGARKQKNAKVDEGPFLESIF